MKRNSGNASNGRFNLTTVVDAGGKVKAVRKEHVAPKGKRPPDLPPR